MSIAKPLSSQNLARRRDEPREPHAPLLDPRGLLYGSIAALINLAAIYVGSGRLAHFDPALIAYTAACVLTAFGVVYRYTVWLEKPPTALYWRRGWQLFLRPSHLLRNLVYLAQIVWTNIVTQKFIDRRSHLRWEAHLLMSWGCLVAVAVTVPLCFGWVNFEEDPTNPANYLAYVFGMRTASFPAHSLVGWMTFHILDFCAVAVIGGMALAMKRRLYDPGALTVQQFAMDFLPLILLFAVSITGLMLTVSSLWLHGHSYSFLALLHAFSVIVTLLYLPFGKFFHIFQRPANLGVQFYKREGQETPQAVCRVCGEQFASAMQVEDLKTVLAELGFDQTMPDGTHYQEVCPRCRRRALAANQLEAIGGPGFL
jgi:hypothetical protein